MNLNRTTIFRVRQRLHETDTVSDRPRSGRPRCTTQRQDRNLVRNHMNNSFLSASASSLHTRERNNQRLSANTVRRRLSTSGLRACRPCIGPILTQRLRHQRTLWAQEHAAWDRIQWRSVVFSDESRFCIDHADGHPEDALVSAQGNKKKKYSETYKGYKVFNTGLDIEEDASGEIAIVAGDVYADIEGDLGTVSHCDISEAVAKAIALSTFGLKGSQVHIVREAYEDYVYVDSDSKARWAVDVELSLFTPSGKFSRPVVFIDVCSQEVLDYFDRSGFFTMSTGGPWDDFTDSQKDDNTGGPWDDFTIGPKDDNTRGPWDDYTNGPKDDNTGGPWDDITDGPNNSKEDGETNGPPDYPSDSPTKAPTKAPTNAPTQSPTNLPTQPPGKCDVVDKAGNPKRPIQFGPGEEFCLTPMRRSSDGTKCFLENEYVKTVDLKGRRDDSSTTIASFRCSDGYDDEINGGFSPVLDAFFFCTASSRLYRALKPGTGQQNNNCSVYSSGTDSARQQPAVTTNDVDREVEMEHKKKKKEEKKKKLKLKGVRGENERKGEAEKQ
ncbi:transposable element Tc1 transposase [Elysia marginata]|uniref:Transposable element Tc1 transposase n=1 Tax=Elysia marginata TaxID=1093978 RepID=A0AAV4JF52_9GAST|nr:transposable element Tc1 transposase [Elysia marginata]